MSFKINVVEVDRLVNALEQYAGDAEQAINDVLHNEAGELIQTEIYRLMPKSDKKKGRHAKDSKSLRNVNENLAITVTSNKAFQYLYFADDGTNTKRHVGNQQFFKKGGEIAQPDIIDRCINKLTEI